jgi:queuine tRNA-ribosyltransferase
LACLDFAPDQLPVDKPRYLGVRQKPDDIVGAVGRIDIFDFASCTDPFGPHRPAFTRTGSISIRNAKFAEDQAIEAGCACPVRRPQAAYLHHRRAGGCSALC